MQSIVNAGDQFAVEINQAFYDLLCARIASGCKVVMMSSPLSSVIVLKCLDARICGAAM